MKIITTYDVALAFARADGLAGQSYGDGPRETSEVRAQNLVRQRYIRAGDPHCWDDGEGDQRPLATVYAECKGGDGDCHPPADYYSRWPELEGPVWWEWINAAVAHVWPKSEPVRVVEAAR